MRQSCLHQPYDDICIITSDTHSSLLLFPNVAVQSLLSSPFPIGILSQSTAKSALNYFLTSTLSYEHSTSFRSNSIDQYGISQLTTSLRKFSADQFKGKFYRKNIWYFVIPIVIGIIICIAFSICCFIKLRRKDVGVYDLEQTQRFRPLMIELPLLSGENNQEILNSTTNTTKSTAVKLHKTRKRKNSLLLGRDDHREFYI